jgi:cytochrome c biogenesis factor
MTAEEREPTAAGAASPSAAEVAEGPEAAVLADPIAVLADELAAIDGLAPGERAELLEADLQLARRLLLEQVTARAVERAYAEDQHAEAVRALRRAQVRVALVEIGVAVVVVGAVVSAVR